MGMLGQLTGLGARDLAIDLGTANTVVYVRGSGVVAAEPSVVAIDERTGEVHAVGDDAQRMIGRTPATISATRPLRHGVIADFEVTEQMLRYFFRRVHQGRFAHPRLVMCAPSGITDVEQRAVEEACMAAGARRVRLIEEPIAAAIGAGLPIAVPTGHMIVDVGGGTTEVAVISLGGIVASRSLRVGGYDFDEAILAHVRRRHDIAVGQPTAERVKFELGSAYPLEAKTCEVRGLDLGSGRPKHVTLTSEEIREAIGDQVRAIVEAVKETLELVPGELSADIGLRGMVLAGGGSLLRGLDVRLSDETGLETHRVEDPLNCVAVGAGRSLERLGLLEDSTSRPRRSGRRTRGANGPRFRPHRERSTV